MSCLHLLALSSGVAYGQSWSSFYVHVFHFSEIYTLALLKIKAILVKVTWHFNVMIWLSVPQRPMCQRPSSQPVTLLRSSGTCKR